MSSGETVRGSMTSALDALLRASWSAAFRASCTMYEVATMVTSLPGRLTSATPRGTS